jgi:hypothetical protein
MGKKNKIKKELHNDKWILGIEFFIMDGFYIRMENKEKRDIYLCLANLRTRLRRMA